MFSINQLEYTWNSFNDKVSSHREIYSIVYEVIEEYISKFKNEKPIILSSNMSISLLLKLEKTKDDFKYNLNTMHALYHANFLTNLISSKIINPLWFVSLKTVIPYKRYAIMVDNINFVVIDNLEIPNKNIDQLFLIKPATVKSFSKKYEFLSIPAKFHLLEIYRNLYSPDKSDTWNESIDFELKLFNYMKENFKHLDLNVKTGGKKIKEKNSGKKIKEKNGNEIQNIQLKILSDFIINNNSVVLIGIHAINIYNKSKQISGVINIISCNDIKHDYEQIVNCIGKDAVILYKTSSVFIFGDSRLSRTSIKIKINDKYKELIYIFNSASYEPIPVFKLLNEKKEFINIGNPFVILRFLIIDIWLIRWVYSTGGIDSKFAKMKTSFITNNIIKIRESISKSSSNNKINIEDYLNANSIFGIFQDDPKKYVGIFQNEIIAQKIKIQSNVSNRYFVEYFPQIYHKVSGEYRIIE